MKQSAGILLYRYVSKTLQVFLVHPGGPFFVKKNAGWWTVPKGEIDVGEDPLSAALREFKEETGYLPNGDFKSLKPIRQKGGKTVMCWAVMGDLSAEHIKSNTFEMEWPPKSGKIKSFPEIDQAGWFSIEEAYHLINAMQQSFLNELIHL